MRQYQRGTRFGSSVILGLDMGLSEKFSRSSMELNSLLKETTTRDLIRSNFSGSFGLKSMPRSRYRYGVPRRTSCSRITRLKLGTNRTTDHGIYMVIAMVVCLTLLISSVLTLGLTHTDGIPVAAPKSTVSCKPKPSYQWITIGDLGKKTVRNKQKDVPMMELPQKPTHAQVQEAMGEMGKGMNIYQIDRIFRLLNEVRSTAYKEGYADGVEKKFGDELR